MGRSAQLMDGDMGHRNRLGRRRRSEFHWIGRPACRGIRLEGSPQSHDLSAINTSAVTRGSGVDTVLGHPGSAKQVTP
jgi:hypothetical protein